jgi:hypothetical protein
VKLSHWVSIKSMLQMLAWGWSVQQQPPAAAAAEH